MVLSGTEVQKKAQSLSILLLCLRDMYGVDVSAALISEVTDKHSGRGEGGWQDRPLEAARLVQVPDCAAATDSFAKWPR